MILIKADLAVYGTLLFFCHGVISVVVVLLCYCVISVVLLRLQILTGLYPSTDDVGEHGV